MDNNKKVTLNDVLKNTGLSEEVIQQWKEDVQKHPIRGLTSEERNIYGGAIIKAQEMLPSYRDALAVLSPYMDATCETAYTDAFARVGLSYWFFYMTDINMKATALLHEASHVLNNHFVRFENIGIRGKIANYAGDLEINTTLQLVPGTDFSLFLLPAKYKYPDYKTLEQYYSLMKEDPQFDTCPECGQPMDGAEKSGSSDDSDSSGNGAGDSSDSQEDSSDSSSGEGSSDSSEGQDGTSSGSGSGSEGSDDSSDQSGNSSGQSEDSHGKCSSCGQSTGNSSSNSGNDSSHGHGHGPGTESGSRACDDATEARSEAADQADIPKSSTAEQNIARRNTAARIREELNSGGIGSGSLSEFLKIQMDRMSPPKVDWKHFFRHIVASSYSESMVGKNNTSYKRVNRRLSSNTIIFPGTVDYSPTIMFAVDTSGSMGNGDEISLLTEIEGIIKSTARTKGSLKVFSVDTTIQNIQTVNSISELKFAGGGGTDMSVAFGYVNDLKRKKRPNIVVLGTDGYTDWHSVEVQLRRATYTPIILVTQKGGFNTVPESLKRRCAVIDVSEEN